MHLQSENTSKYLFRRNFFDEALKAIPQPLSKGDAERIEILLTKVQSRMRLQLSCLINHVNNDMDSGEIGSNNITTV